MEQQWVEGHYDEQWVEGRWEDQWVEGYWNESWVDGQWVDEWVEGHPEDQWVDGYWDDDGNWQDGYWETVWVDGYWNSTWVDGYWDSSWVEGHNETVWVDGYLDATWVDGFWEDVWIDGYTDSAWVEGYWDSVTIPAHTEPPVWVQGYLGWTLYPGYTEPVWIEGQWVGPWTWTPFDEVGNWYPTSAWSPDTNTVPAPQPFPQTCAAAREHRTGERNEAGGERNVAASLETGGTLSRPAIGTGTTSPASAPVVGGGSASGTVGVVFSSGISATNSPTSYGASGLPGGLAVSSSSGEIAGMPTEAGTFSVSLTAANSAGTSNPATLVLTIAPSGALPVVSGGSASGTVGTIFAYDISATNSPTSYGASGLPGGLAVNSATGHISGTPTQAGTFSVSLTATNSAGTSGTATLVLTVDGGGGGGVTTYTLSVVNGTGGAAGLLPGATRTIVASVPAGALFTGWEISGPATIPPSRLGATRILTMGTGNVTATATYQFPGSQPLWFDVNDDGIRDEVATRGMLGFNYAISDIWTTYDYESDNWDIFFDWRDQYWPGGFSIDGFPNLWLYSRPPVVTNITTWVSADALFDAETNEQYAIMGWNSAGYWGDYASIILQAGHNLHPTIYLPSFHAEDFLAFQFVRARIGLPIHSFQINGLASVAIGGVQLLSLPATGGATVSLSAKNVLGKLLQNGPRIVWEVWDAINNVRIGNSTLGDVFDVQINAAGQWRVVARLDDRTGVSFTFDAQRPTTPVFITPAGDPVNAPVEAGDVPNSIPDGANEFTYSSGSTGVLTVKLKARVPGLQSLSATDQARYKFIVMGVGDSVMAWDPTNPLGQPTISGDVLEAKVAFAGLPTNNSAFGPKTARLAFGGVPVVDQSFEVFFPTQHTNHPGGQYGSPNWYYYWMQTPANKTNNTPTIYNNGSRSFYNFPFEDKIYLSNDAASVGSALQGTPVGIDYFAWTTAHEAKHSTQLMAFWPGGYNAALDNDGPSYLRSKGDDIPDGLEATYMPGRNYDPTKYATFPDEVGYGQNPIPDREDIAMRSQVGPPYELHRMWENGSANDSDWANPGKNSKNRL